MYGACSTQTTPGCEVWSDATTVVCNQCHPLDYHNSYGSDTTNTDAYGPDKQPEAEPNWPPCQPRWPFQVNQGFATIKPDVYKSWTTDRAWEARWDNHTVTFHVRDATVTVRLPNQPLLPNGDVAPAFDALRPNHFVHLISGYTWFLLPDNGDDNQKQIFQRTPMQDLEVPQDCPPHIQTGPNRKLQATFNDPHGYPWEYYEGTYFRLPPCPEAAPYPEDGKIHPNGVYTANNQTFVWVSTNGQTAWHLADNNPIYQKTVTIDNRTSKRHLDQAYLKRTQEQTRWPFTPPNNMTCPPPPDHSFGYLHNWAHVGYDSKEKAKTMHHPGGNPHVCTLCGTPLDLLWEWQQHDHQFLMRKRRFAKMQPPLPASPEEHRNVDDITLQSPLVADAAGGRRIALYGLTYESYR